MSSLAKRVDALEEVVGYKGKDKTFLWVEYPSDGGLICDGQFYPDTESLFHAEGLEQASTHIIGCGGDGKTAAELLEEAAERKRNPPPPVSIDELGEYGRQLVNEGISPTVAKLLEDLTRREK